MDSLQEVWESWREQGQLYTPIVIVKEETNMLYDSYLEPKYIPWGDLFLTWETSISIVFKHEKGEYITDPGLDGWLWFTGGEHLTIENPHIAVYCK